MTKIQFYIKNVYGKDTMYIADKDISAIIANLTGRKVLTPEHKQQLEKLGFTFELVMQPTTL